MLTKTNEVPRSVKRARSLRSSTKLQCCWKTEKIDHLSSSRQCCPSGHSRLFSFVQADTYMAYASAQANPHLIRMSAFKANCFQLVIHKLTLCISKQTMATKMFPSGDYSWSRFHAITSVHSLLDCPFRTGSVCTFNPWDVGHFAGKSMTKTNFCLSDSNPGTVSKSFLALHTLSGCKQQAFYSSTFL